MRPDNGRTPSIALALLAAAALLLAGVGCSISTRFQGPGFQRSRGVVADLAGDTVIVSLTHATVDRAGRKTFDRHVGRIVDHLESLEASEGFIGFSIGMRVPGKEVWTVTAWTDEAALDAFVRSSVHAAAIRESGGALEALRLRRVALPRDELPLSWKRAFELLDAAPGHAVGRAVR